MAKTKKAKMPKLEVYSVKAKAKVEILPKSAYMTVNPNGSFMLRGETKDGDSVAGIIGKAKAEDYKAAGIEVREN